MDIMSALFDEDEVKRRYEFRLKEEGKEEKAIETARNFLKLGLPISQVAMGTQLSIENVERIARGTL